MKAVQFEEFGGPEVLQYVDVPEPGTPTGTQVLLRMKAVGVNYHDSRQRRGVSTGATAPGIPGLELAGIVEAIGPDVSDLAVGDAVFGRARRSYAELVMADAADMFALPESMSFAEAAVIPVAFLTASHALLHKGHLQEGERLLVQAGASSVGTAALQIARWKNAWTIATSASDEKLARLRDELGLAAGINYETEDLPTRVAELTDGKLADITMDGVGRTTFLNSVKSTRMGGRVLVYGAASGSDEVTFQLGEIANRGQSVTGFSITQEKALFRGTTMPFFRETILPLFANGTLKSMLKETMSLADAVASHQRIIDRAVYGKVALIPEGA